LGEVIEFYHPPPRANTLAENMTVADKAALETEPPAISAEDILKKCLANVGKTDQILIMTADKDGVLGFVTNCDGLAESILFIELIKAQALFSRTDTGGGGIA
jgi:hypothetical protein